MCTHRQIVARFVESDVAVGPNAEQLQVDAARGGDRGFVSIAFGVQVGSDTIQKVDSFSTEVDAVEQVTLHEGPEASWIPAVYAGEFVKIERGDARPVGGPGRRQSAQLRISVDRRAPRRQAEDR